MISVELELSLHLAFMEARQKRHEYITIEHLLLCLLDNASAKAAILACSESAGVLELLKKDLKDFIEKHTPVTAGTEDVDTQPTLGFQRVLQRAILQVDAMTGENRKEVRGANVLVSIFGEKDSHAVHFLHKQYFTRLDIVNFLVHGIRKDGKEEDVPAGDQEKLSVSVFKLIMKLKDGEADPRFAKLVQDFRDALEKEGLAFKTEASEDFDLTEFLLSDRPAVIGHSEKCDVVFFKK